MPDEKLPFHNPFASLASLRDTLPGTPSQPVQPVPAKPERQPTASTHATIPRAVVRMERTGRGGKEVTVIDHLEVTNREQWLKQLKSALGCGGTIEGQQIVLQGDHRERLKTLLSERGVKKVIVG